MSKSTKAPRGAQKLCRLIVSDLAETNKAKYRQELIKIGNTKGLNHLIRDTANRMANNHRQSFPNVKG